MAIKVNFLNNTYNQDDFVRQFKTIVTTNVVVGSVNSLKVTESNPNGLKVIVASGEAWINGYYINSDSNTELSIDGNLTGATRKDIVVLELQEENNTAVFKVVKGTATAPTPTSTQKLLAEITVLNNALSISNGNIADKRELKDGAVANADTLNGFKDTDFTKKADLTNERINDEWSLNVFGLFTIKVGIHRSPGIHKGGWTKINYKKQFTERCYVVVPTLIQVVDSPPTDATIMIKGSWERRDCFEVSTSSTTPYPFMWIAVGR